MPRPAAQIQHLPFLADERCELLEQFAIKGLVIQLVKELPRIRFAGLVVNGTKKIVPRGDLRGIGCYSLPKATPSGMTRSRLAIRTIGIWLSVLILHPTRIRCPIRCCTRGNRNGSEAEDGLGAGPGPGKSAAHNPCSGCPASMAQGQGRSQSARPQCTPRTPAIQAEPIPKRWQSIRRTPRPSSQFRTPRTESQIADRATPAAKARACRSKF